MVIHPEFI